MPRRARIKCEGETPDDFDCARRASRIGEWLEDGQPTVRIPLCRRCARQKIRHGWTVRKATPTELHNLTNHRTEDTP